MLKVVIIASGSTYQDAAARAASTFVRQIDPQLVTVLLPDTEETSGVLKGYSQKHGFLIQKFPFLIVSEKKFTSQLKCQAFLFAMSQLGDRDLQFMVDADTYCSKPLLFSKEIGSAILEGKIGMVPDVKDRHCRKPSKPWFLTPEERATYVNSGVILAARSSLKLFKVFADLSARHEFLSGPFNDQKVINFALGKYFKDRLILWDKVFNGMRQYRSADTIIGHYAGGAGRFSESHRQKNHATICAQLLRS